MYIYIYIARRPAHFSPLSNRQVDGSFPILEGERGVHVVHSTAHPHPPSVIQFLVPSIAPNSLREGLIVH